MNSRTSAQDVTYCDLCKRALIKMHCETCFINLCTACVGVHMEADELFDHNIVKFHSKKSSSLYPSCASHDKELCAMYCNHCEIPVCLSCLTTDQHLGHRLSKVSQVLEEKKSQAFKDQSELSQTIYPTYQHIASDIQDIITQSKDGYEDLTKAITEHGEDLHQEINKLINTLKTKVNGMKEKQMRSLQKHLDEVNKKLSDIKDEIHLFGNVLDSNDISKLTSVEGNVDKFKKLPDKIVPSLPKFTPKKPPEDKFSELFGNVSSFSFSSRESKYNFRTKKKSPPAESFPQVVQQPDEPEVIATISTDYKHVKNVACLSDDSFWVCGDDDIMKLFNVEKDTPPKSIKTISGNTPASITVTPTGDFVFTDYMDKTVNILKNEKIKTVIRLNSWIPRGVCGTPSGDLLVTMVSEDKTQSKVVRYSGFKEKQSIQYDVKGQPLYQCAAYITINRNKDVCVSDLGTRSIVVVNEAGKQRFKYTGKSHTQRNKPFYPQGITTDSQSRILIADSRNSCIDIVNKNGEFLRYIDCELKCPWGICTDENNYLFVAEYRGKKVKKVKYQHCTNENDRGTML